MKEYDVVTNEENELTKNILRISNYVLGGFNKWRNSMGLCVDIVYRRECFPSFDIKITKDEIIKGATLQGTVAFILKNKLFPNNTDYAHFYTSEILPEK